LSGAVKRAALNRVRLERKVRPHVLPVLGRASSDQGAPPALAKNDRRFGGYLEQGFQKAAELPIYLFFELLIANPVFAKCARMYSGSSVSAILSLGGLFSLTRARTR